MLKTTRLSKGDIFRMAHGSDSHTYYQYQTKRRHKINNPMVEECLGKKFVVYDEIKVLYDCKNRLKKGRILWTTLRFRTETKRVHYYSQSEWKKIHNDLILKKI